MPELPEVETIKEAIKLHLVDKSKTKFIGVEILQPKLRYMVPKDLEANIKNQQLLDITRRAKYLKLHTINGNVIIHFGMSGVLRFSSNKDFDRENIAKHTHVIFSTTNGYLLYNDPRKFGCILFESENNRLPFFDNLGVEPLLEGWNKEYFYEKIKNKNTAIKSLLMNQNIVVGIGNIYATETLFSTKIHPKISGKNITKKQCGEIVSNSIKHLKKAIECGGTTLKDFKNPDGKPGYFANELQVYGREKEKCTKCESIIQKIVISQRSSFFCPSCQKI